MGEDREKRLEELIEEVDRPETQESDSTNSVSPTPESTTSEIDSVPSDSRGTELENESEVRFPTNPAISTHEEFLRAGLISLGMSFLVFVTLVYILVIQVQGYEKMNFLNSILFSIAAFLYIFKYISFNK